MGEIGEIDSDCWLCGANFEDVKNLFLYCVGGGCQFN